MFNKYRRIAIDELLGILLLVCILLVVFVCQLKQKSLSLQKELSNTNQKIVELETKLDKFKGHTKKEFESTWRSFGRVRNNFLAIGHGYHLEEDDFAPQEEQYTIAKEVK